MHSAGHCSLQFVHASQQKVIPNTAIKLPIKFIEGNNNTIVDLTHLFQRDPCVCCKFVCSNSIPAAIDSGLSGAYKNN